MERWEERLDFSEADVLDLSERAGPDQPHPLQMWVMPLVVITAVDGVPVELLPVGTGFCAGVGLIATAKHVVESALEKTRAADGRSFYAMYQRARTASTPNWGIGLPIRMSHTNPATDLAILEFVPSPRPDARYYQRPLTFRDPAPGTQVLALGYPEMTSEVNENSLTLNRRLVAAQGVVEEVRHDARDQTFSYFPALQADFPSPSGMSGGPICDTQGNVVALVSTAMEPLKDDSMRWCVTGALLAFLLAFNVEIDLDTGPRKASIHQLATGGIVPTDGSHHAVRFSEKGTNIEFDLSRLWGQSS
jgi:S1-C subfamily serine protease